MILDFVFPQFAGSLLEHTDRIVYIEGVGPLPMKAVSHQVFKHIFVTSTG